jgi:uncharacterized membrane protein YeaQ/YmgE (transglycosylase-associated protein family)
VDIGEIIAVVVIGLIAGLLGRAIMPGRQGMGLLLTIVVGIVGAFVGFLIFTELLGIGDSEKFDAGSLPGAVIGTILVLFLYERFAGGSTRPAV